MAVKMLILSPSPDQQHYLSNLSSTHLKEVVFTAENCLHSNGICSNGSCCDMMIVGDCDGMSGLELIGLLNARGCQCPPSKRAVIALFPHGREIKQARELGIRVFTPPLRISEFCQWLDKCI